MVTDATKKLREPVAYILLAFAALSVLAVLILLFFGDSTFAANALRAQSRLAPGDVSGIVLLLVLAGSVWLVNEAGERTPNARLVTTAALAITGLALLIGLIATFSVFGANGSGGLLTATFISSLAGLALYGAVGYYIFTAFQGLPAAVRAPKAGQFGPQGQGQYGGGQYGQQQPPQFGQQGGQYGQPGQQGQFPQQGQFEQGQQNQYGGYAAAAGAGAAAGAAGGYAAAQGDQQWPQEQAWNQGEQQPAWSAGDADAQQHAPADPAWSASAQPAAEPTQQWSSEGQQQWSGQESQESQWPQEQAQSSQWADGGQQQWSGQDYPQQEWPSQSGQAQAEQAQPEGQPAWQSGEQQAWPAEDAPAAEPKAADAAPAAEPVADETRVDPRVSETDKDDQGQQGQGQQGWWSQPS